MKADHCQARPNEGTDSGWVRLAAALVVMSTLSARANLGGEPVEVDDETARLIDFSESLHRLSDGRFDITSGVLREAWRFDGSDNVPSRSCIDAILPRIGWDKVRWENRTLTLRPGMQVDLGGVGKEYAADRCAGVATSGDSRRLLLRDGVRYSHILDPLTGWPVAQAPRAVTVVAPSCTQAGMMATLASLQGADAEAFLDAQGLRYWVQR